MSTPRSQTAGRSSHGFTLLELMAAVVITLILLTLTLPGFQAQRFHVHRMEAVRLLDHAAACRLRVLTLRHGGNWHHCVPSSTLRYRFQLVPHAGGLSQGYDWRAEPLGEQQKDACGTLVLDHLGQRSELGVGSGNHNCWR